MLPQFPGAPAEAMGHHTEMQRSMLSLPGSPAAMEDLEPVSDQHPEGAQLREQEHGSHFDEAFFHHDNMSLDHLPAHVPDDFDWSAFDETYRISAEQGPDALSGRPNFTPTLNARGHENMQHLAEAHGGKPQLYDLFERGVETGNESPLSGDLRQSFMDSPIPPSINSVLKEPHTSAHNKTLKVHIKQATAHHGIGSSNAQDHEHRDELSSCGNPSAQHHDVSVESIDVGSSNVETHADTDHASTAVGTADAHRDVEMIESHTSESHDTGTPVAQTYIEGMEESAEKTTPPLAKQSDGGQGRNGSQGQNGARPEPFHSDLSGEKDETSEGHSSSQKNSGDRTPPEANIEERIDPRLTAPPQDVAPNSELANMSSDRVHNAENASETPADSQEAQVAHNSGGQGVATSSMQNQAGQHLNHPTNNQAHRPAPEQQSPPRSLSSTAALNPVDQSQERPARDISNEQQIQTRPDSSERPAQGQTAQGPHASPVPAATPNGHSSSETPQALSKKASPDTTANAGKRQSKVEISFRKLHEIPGPTPHDIMNPINPEWSRQGVQTRFTSLEEAMDALNRPKGPPRDPDLVVSQHQKLAIVNCFLQAMMNLEDVDEGAKTLVVWQNLMKRRPQAIEVACWNVLESMINYHRTTPLPQVPIPKKRKEGKKEDKDNEEEETDEKTKDPTRTGALLSFPERAAAIARIFHVSKSTCKRMLDFKAQYIQTFVDIPLSAWYRCRGNIIGNKSKGGMIKIGKEAKAKAKAEAEEAAKAEAEPQVGKDSAEEDNEVEDALVAEDDDLHLAELLEETADNLLDQVTAGQTVPPSASAAPGQSSYAQNGQYSQSYSMQGQNNAGQNRVMSNTGHDQGMNNNGQFTAMAYSGQQQGVPNTGHNNVMNNNAHNPRTAYSGHRAVSNSGQNHAMNNHRHVQGTTAYSGHRAVSNVRQNHATNNHRHVERMAYSGHGVFDTGHNGLMPNNGQISDMLHPGQQAVPMPNTGYSNGIPGVSNTGQIPRTTNPGQFPPTNGTGLQSGMNNMASMYMDPAPNAPRPPYDSNSGYDQLISELSATAAPNSHGQNSPNPFDPCPWTNSFNVEMPPPLNPAQHFAQPPALLPTYHPQTSTPTSMAGPNPVISRNMGSNLGMPPKNTRARKRSSAETGDAEAGPAPKKRR